MSATEHSEHADHADHSGQSTPGVPRILADVRGLDDDPSAAGAVWRLDVADRDLDANVIALPAGDAIDVHTGADLDVLVHVLAGDGVLLTEHGDVALSAGVLAWLPRRSRRGFRAGPEGLRYLTVHHRRQALVLQTSPPAP